MPPFVGVRCPPVIVHGLGGEQQQVALLDGEGLLAVEDLALAFDGQVDDPAMHAVGPVDEKVQRPVAFDRRDAGDKAHVEGEAGKQRRHVGVDALGAGRLGQLAENALDLGVLRRIHGAGFVEIGGTGIVHVISGMLHFLYPPSKPNF